MAKKNYNKGGDLLMGLFEQLPYIGPIVGLANDQINELPNRNDMSQNTRVFPGGGHLVSGFTQYNGPSHANGGIPVDANGNPTKNQPVAEVQNKENHYNNYVFSDTLKNPLTGQAFNIDMSQLVNKFKEADTDLIQRNALDLGANRLKKVNDLVRDTTSEKFTSQGSSKSKSSDKLYEKAEGGNIVTRRKEARHQMELFKAQGGLPMDIFKDASAYGKMMTQFDSLPMANTQAGIQPTQPLDYAPTSQFRVGRQPTEALTPAALPFDLGQGAMTFPEVNINPATAAGEPGVANDLNDQARAMKLAALGKSAFDAILPAEKEDVLLPNRTDARRFLDDSYVDFTASQNAALSASNQVSDLNRSSATGFANFRAREVGRLGALQQAQSQINERQNVANAGVNYNRGQFENAAAVDNTNRQAQNRVNNQMNEANARNFGRAFFENLSGYASALNKEQYVKDTISNNKEMTELVIREGLAILSAKNPNFQLAPDYVQKVKEGNYTLDDLVKFVGFAEENK